MLMSRPVSSINSSPGSPSYIHRQFHACSLSASSDLDQSEQLRFKHRATAAPTAGRTCLRRAKFQKPGHYGHFLTFCQGTFLIFLSYPPILSHFHWGDRLFV